MEKNTAALIKGMAEALESAVNEKEMWLALYREEQERSERLKAELKSLKAKEDDF